MLIILEGPDGAGKTTLANQLVDELSSRFSRHKVELLHKGPPTDHPLVEYETPLLDYQPDEEHHIVCDRWHLGELIYPQVFGRHSQITPAMLWHIELLLKKKGALLVHVTSPLNVLQSRLAARGDDLVHSSQLADLRAVYAREVSATCLPNLITKDVDLIINRALGHERVASDLNSFVTYVGPHWPSILLLGDVRNEKIVDQYGQVPAFWPTYNSSGHYLLSTLLSRGSRVSFTNHLGLANACDVDDPRLLWETLGRPLVVTLGKQADQRIDVLPRRHVPHPQWVKRFAFRSQQSYADAILAGKEFTWQK